MHLTAKARCPAASPPSAPTGHLPPQGGKGTRATMRRACGPVLRPWTNVRDYQFALNAVMPSTQA